MLDHVLRRNKAGSQLTSSPAETEASKGSPRTTHQNLSDNSESTSPPLTFLSQSDPAHQEKELQENIRALIKQDHTQALEAFIDEHPELLDFALRVSSVGYLDCLRMLLKKGANPMSAGPKPGKIALHYAIEHCFPEGIQALLSQKNATDQCNPCKQLLFGEKPSRPIDCIAQLSTIRDRQLVLSSQKPSNGPVTTNARRIGF